MKANNMNFYDYYIIQVPILSDTDGNISNADEIPGNTVTARYAGGENSGSP